MQVTFFRSNRVLWVVYSLVAVLTGLQKWGMGFNEKGVSKYENYRIFKHSWEHLIKGENPYALYPDTWDLYKYSPAFAVFMAPFSVLPDWLGVALWNLINALPLLYLLLRAPGITDHNRRLMAWFVLPELLISLQNTQSNGLVAALILGVWVALDRRQAIFAAGLLLGGAFLKLFGIFAGLFLVYYRSLWWRVVGFSILWGLVLFFLPLPLIGLDALVQVYQWWWEMLKNDHSTSLGLSVAGWLQSWFGLMPNKLWLTATGLLLQVGAVVWAVWKRKSIIPVIASVLIWVVIFNHKAESPTFIIALCGAALWFFSLRNPGIIAKVGLLLVFICSSITPTDLFPSVWNRTIVQPYVIKAVPYILLWVWLLLDLYFNDEQRTDLEVF